MNLLIARQVDGRWTKIAAIKASSSSLNLPEACRGQIAGRLAKLSRDFFLGEPAARTLNYEISGSQWRVDRF